MNKIKNLIFDVDGTLWNAVPQITEAWNETLSSSGEAGGRVLSTEEMYGCMGYTMEEIGARLLPELESSLREALLERCMEHENEFLKGHGGELYPALTETLTRLHEEGRRLYIVSNCQDGYIQALLSWAGYSLGERGLFRDFECFGRTLRPKGENIRLLMERNGICPEEALYVGDTRMDEEAAGMAGIPFFHAAYGFGTAKSPAAVLAEPSELLEKLRAYEGAFPFTAPAVSGEGKAPHL